MIGSESRTKVISRSLIFRWEAWLWLGILLIPLLINGPQWLTGSLVNALLLIGADKLTKQKRIPLVILPSLGAVGHGVLFGSFTWFLVYFLPFIWLANWILINVFSGLKKRSGWLALMAAASVKAMFLFLVANIYVRLKIVPTMFVSVMGVIQWLTAISGGILALMVLSSSVFNNERR